MVLGPKVCLIGTSERMEGAFQVFFLFFMALLQILDVQIIARAKALTAERPDQSPMLTCRQFTVKLDASKQPVEQI